MSEKRENALMYVQLATIAIFGVLILYCGRDLKQETERIPISEYVDYPVGTIVGKYANGSRFTIEVLGYGKMLVDEDEWSHAQVGRKVDKKLEGRLLNGRG